VANFPTNTVQLHHLYKPFTPRFLIMSNTARHKSGMFFSAVDPPKSNKNFLLSRTFQWRRNNYVQSEQTTLWETYTIGFYACQQKAATQQAAAYTTSYCFSFHIDFGMGFVMRKYACVEAQSHFRLPEMEAAVESVFQKLDGLVQR